MDDQNQNVDPVEPVVPATEEVVETPAVDAPVEGPATSEEVAVPDADQADDAKEEEAKDVEEEVKTESAE